MKSIEEVGYWQVGRGAEVCVRTSMSILEARESSFGKGSNSWWLDSVIACQ